MTPLLYHQVVKLGRGAHSTPAHGACVMELVSMLAGEPFSDRPRCASPVITGFLRAYNDLLDDDRRQDLRPYAAAVVGTRGDRATEVARGRRCLEWADERPSLLRHDFITRLVVARGYWLGVAGMYAGAAAWGVRRTDAAHAEALSFLDELVGIGEPPLPRVRLASPRMQTVEHPAVRAA
jgi:hypothetical protein